MAARILAFGALALILALALAAPTPIAQKQLPALPVDFSVTMNIKNIVQTGNTSQASNIVSTSFVWTSNNMSATNQTITLPSLSMTYYMQDFTRYDLGMKYEVFNYSWSPTPTCDHDPVTGTMPSPWAVFAAATYVGPQTFQGQAVDVYQVTVPDESITFGVSAADNTIPVFAQMTSVDPTQNVTSLITFSSFTPTTSFSLSVFNPPSICNTTKAVAPATNMVRRRLF
eukprot:m.51112 g.51112  ORF g.51112 m.51112 type:complete len:228 (+) comp6278_c0_seq1:38-721(+)